MSKERQGVPPDRLSDMVSKERQRLVVPPDRLEELSTGIVAFSQGARASAVRLLKRPLCRPSVACMDRILEACHRFDKHKNGWVPISCYELALKAAGADLEGTTNADRFQTLYETFGDCVQLDTSENDNRKGLVYYSAVDQRVRTALASTIFASSCEELEKAEARSGKDSLFSAPGGDS